MRIWGGATKDVGQSLSNLTESVEPMIAKAVANARAHGINLHSGVRNLATGDCAFETIIDSMSIRSCFEEVYDGTPEYWRRTWMSVVEQVAYNGWHGGLSMSEWNLGWDKLKESGTYEYTLGDLVVPGIAHCTKKDILIFNTSSHAHYPTYVVQASSMCGQAANNEIPVCLAYNQTHYEMLVPDTDEDIMKTIRLKHDIVSLWKTFPF